MASASDKNSTSALSTKFSVSSNNGVEFSLDVRNNTKKMVELRFPDGQTHDFFVQDASGREVWRWSRSRMFTQGMQNKLVKAKDVAVFSEHWNVRNLRGRFTAVAVLPSGNHPIEERVQFELK